MREELTVNCPTCGKKVERTPSREPRYFPFCSERCQLVDLGKWFEGEHRIEEPLDPGGAGPDGAEG